VGATARDLQPQGARTDAMNEQPSVVTCRWARESIRLPYPYWLNADNVAWTCLRDGEPHELDDPDICRDCPRWQSRRLRASES
jgi:hypothetical protein